MAKKQTTSNQRTNMIKFTPKAGEAHSEPRNMTTMELPKVLTTQQLLVPICCQSEACEDGPWWGFYRANGDTARSFTNNCPGCHGSYETLYAPAAFCPWCGTELDPDKAELFGEATL